MAVQILSRRHWTSTSARGRAFNWSRVRGIVAHYPAMGGDVGVLTQDEEEYLIRSWRNYHVNVLGWVDLGYNFVIAMSGRIYTGRGERVAAHSVGHNSTTVGVLFIAGNNEVITAAAEASFRALRATLRRKGCGSGVWGHREMSGNSTRCPGPKIMASIRAGRLTSGSTSAPKPRPGDPSRPWLSSPRVAGMSAAEVRKVQKALADRGYDLGKWGVDGKYGEATYNAVRAAQKALGVAVDGIAGPDTMKALTGDAPKAPAIPAGGTSVPAVKDDGDEPAPKPKLKVDGRLGHASVRALQQWLNEEHDAGLVVDGKAGDKTWRALQKVLGTPVDGVVSRQSYKASELGNGITQGWDYTGRGSSGSTMVRALQKRLGITVDGIWGEGTTRALQKALNADTL